MPSFALSQREDELIQFYPNCCQLKRYRNLFLKWLFRFAQKWGWVGTHFSMNNLQILNDQRQADRQGGAQKVEDRDNEGNKNNKHSRQP